MLLDVKKVTEEARKQIAEEKTEKAKRALVQKLRALDTAKDVVRNIEREIADLEASITDGSFVG